MEKAFDFKALGEELKAQGLPIAEDAAKKLVETVVKWVNDSAAMHENVLVKTIVPVAVQALKPILDEQVDKIDGQVG